MFQPQGQEMGPRVQWLALSPHCKKVTDLILDPSGTFLYMDFPLAAPGFPYN